MASAPPRYEYREIVELREKIRTIDDLPRVEQMLVKAKNTLSRMRRLQHSRLSEQQQDSRTTDPSCIHTSMQQAPQHGNYGRSTVGLLPADQELRHARAAQARVDELQVLADKMYRSIFETREQLLRQLRDRLRSYYGR